MSISDALFYVFAVVTVGSGILVVTTRNVVYAAFSLMMALAGMAVLYVLLHADFLAATQVLVYVGGILVLVLFGVMMTSGSLDIKLKIERRRALPGALVCLLLLGLLLAIVLQFPWGIQENPNTGSTTEAIGKSLLGKYLLPFEIASLLLLVALVGAALITRKEVKDTEE